MQKNRLGLMATLALTAVLATAAGALVQDGLRLVVGGKTASTDIRIMGGRPYVPLADMARAMNGSAVKRQGRYEIIFVGGDATTPDGNSGRGAGRNTPGRDTTTPDGSSGRGPGRTTPGGANEVNGTRGKIGQVLFNGKWRFSVVGVDRAAHYDSQFLSDKRTFNPNGDTEELIIVHCRMKNGQKETSWAMLSPIHPHHTALTDNRGQSYAPLNFDKRGGHTDEGPDLLPGAQTDFAIMFSVPRGTVLQDLVFSVQSGYDDATATDVRISLAP